MFNGIEGYRVADIEFIERNELLCFYKYIDYKTMNNL